jgi:hypothetical protein
MLTAIDTSVAHHAVGHCSTHTVSAVVPMSKFECCRINYLFVVILFVSAHKNQTGSNTSYSITSSFITMAPSRSNKNTTPKSPSSPATAPGATSTGNGGVVAAAGGSGTTGGAGGGGGKPPPRCNTSISLKNSPTPNKKAKTGPRPPNVVKYAIGKGNFVFVKGTKPDETSIYTRDATVDLDSDPSILKTEGNFIGHANYSDGQGGTLYEGIYPVRVFIAELMDPSLVTYDQQKEAGQAVAEVFATVRLVSTVVVLLCMYPFFSSLSHHTFGSPIFTLFLLSNSFLRVLSITHTTFSLLCLLAMLLSLTNLALLWQWNIFCAGVIH